MTTDFTGLVDAAIYTRLTTTAGTAFYGLRCFDSQAPEGTQLPYVIFSQIAGGNDNLTPSDSNDLVYRIECIGASRADAATGSGYIEVAFTLQNTIDVTNYSNYAFQRREAFRRIDNIGGTQYYRRGSNYRIRHDHT